MKHSFQQLDEACKGRWDTIFLSLARELEDAINRYPKHVACPRHDGMDGFRLFKDFKENGGAVCNSCGSGRGWKDGYAVLSWVKQWDNKETIRQVAALAASMGWLASDDSSVPKSSLNQPPIDPQQPKETPEWNRAKEAKIMTTWKHALPASHALALPLRRYFEKRGLQLRHIPPTIRFVPLLDYYEQKEGSDNWVKTSEHPAILSPLVQLDGRMVTLQRIYITEAGDKAAVPAAKMRMSPPLAGASSGTAVRLFQPGKTLGLAEGIETALAVHLATGIPMWATTSAGLLEVVEIPEHVESVLIWADLDKSNAGQHAASKLADRMARLGKNAVVFLPPGPIPEGKKGVDWEDVYNQNGAHAFPKLIYTKKPLSDQPSYRVA